MNQKTVITLIHSKEDADCTSCALCYCVQ